MSNVKISNLTETATLADSDELAVVDVSDTAQAASGSTRKTLLSTLRSWLGKDEDDMASDSATHFPTQQSVKAYVDAGTSQLAPDEITIEAVAPKYVLIDTDEADDEKRAAILWNNKLLTFRTENDAGSATNVILQYDQDDDTINLTNVDAVTVPAPTADSHAATKAYVDAETSQLLPLDGSEDMTGNLVIAKANPRLEMTPTSGTAGLDFTDADGDTRQLWYYDAPNERFIVNQYDEDGGFVRTALRLTEAGLWQFLGTVEVPAPTADSHAATKEYVDDETSQLLPLDGSEDMTGSLTVARAEADSEGAMVAVRNTLAASGLRGMGILARSNGRFYVMRLDDSGDPTGDIMIYVGENGEVQFPSATSVTVPAPTGANQPIRTAAAPVSATGFTGLVATSDTGWRNITPVNGWAATRLQIRRIGWQVFVNMAGMNAVSASNPAFYDVPGSFRYGLTDEYLAIMLEGVSFDPHYLYVDGTHRLRFITAAGGDPSGTITSYRGQISFPTTAAWPTSLPGTAA